MEEIINFLRTDTFLIIIGCINIVVLVLYIISVVRLGKIKNNYTKFMKKLGNGNDIEAILRSYIERVENVSEKNEEIINYCKRLDNDIAKCIKKVGIVRYSAFKDTGSDLSFALALLNDNNDGVVLNGIYSREMSNIYAKPINGATSTYTISEEEKEAINRAINAEGIQIREK